MDDFDNAESLAAQFQDRLSGIGADGSNAGRGGSRRGGGRGGNRRGGGRGGVGGGNRTVDISRALSKLLRHQAANAGIQLDAGGFASLEQVMQWGPVRSLKTTLAEIRDVVLNNDKQRFAIKWAGDDTNTILDPSTIKDTDSPAEYMIRANQGHSIASVTSDSGLLTPIDTDEKAAELPVVCHGTYFAFWTSIEASGGLKRMTRNHVHFGFLEPGKDGADSVTNALRARAVIPGLRRDAQILVFVDVRRALRDDPTIKWWRAANNVILTEGDADGKVPTKYFQRVVTSPVGTERLPRGPDSAPTELLLWEDGKRVADVPAPTLAQAKVPQGKEGVQRRTNAAAGGASGEGKKRNQGRRGPLGVEEQ